MRSSKRRHGAQPRRGGGGWFLLGLLAALSLIGSSCGASAGGSGSGSGGAGGGAGGGGGSGGASVGGGGASAGGQAGAPAGGRGGLVGSCPGYVAPPGQPCRQDTDCVGGTCTPSPVQGACGILAQPHFACTTDASCAASGMICEPTTKQPCAQQADTACVLACSATSCPVGSRCGSTGRCEPQPCTEGFTCPAGRVCRSSPTGADRNGCSSSSCAQDGWACPAGTHCDAQAPDANANGCVLDHCDGDGWTCPKTYACGVPGDARHCHCTAETDCGPNRLCNVELGRCDVKACRTDDTCDCGVCINHACQLGPWACQFRVP